MHRCSSINICGKLRNDHPQEHTFKFAVAATLTTVVSAAASAGPDISKAQALARLKSTPAHEKVPALVMDQLLDKQGGEFVVE